MKNVTTIPINASQPIQRALILKNASSISNARGSAVSRFSGASQFIGSSIQKRDHGRLCYVQYQSRRKAQYEKRRDQQRIRRLIRKSLDVFNLVVSSRQRAEENPINGAQLIDC